VTNGAIGRLSGALRIHVSILLRLPTSRKRKLPIKGRRGTQERVNVKGRSNSGSTPTRPCVGPSNPRLKTRKKS
jgi:hypothetical protein